MTSNNKILVVAESIDIEDSSGSKANVALIINLVKEGFEVVVYHYSHKDITLPEVICVPIKEKKINYYYLLSRLQRKIQNNLNINLAKYFEKWLGYSFTFFNDTRSISAALKEIKDFKPDLVITLSKGASFRPHMAVLKTPAFHKMWLAYIHDPYPFHNYPPPYNWSEPGYPQKIQFFQEMFSKAKWVAFPSLLLQNWMLEKYPVFKHKSFIIPHQITDKIKSKSPNQGILENKKFSILHAGNLMAGRPPYALIEGFKEFLIDNPSARKETQLIFIGQNSSYRKELGDYKKEISQLYISDGYVNYNLVKEVQNSSSVNVIIESIAEISPFLPGKFPHCVSSNRPIIILGPKKSEVRRLLGEDYPYFAELDNPEKIKQIIQELYLIWKRSPETLTLNRIDLEKYLSSESLKTTINEILSFG